MAHRDALGRVRRFQLRARVARPVAPFPPAPLKFRTAGFPQYGFKAGLSGGSFPRAAPVKPAPGIPLATCGLSAPFALSKSRPTPPLDGGMGDGWSATVRAVLSALPQGPSLRSGLFCPGPSTLIRPHPPHSQAHRDFAAWRLIRDAFAIAGAPSRPVSGSELSSTVPW